MPNFLNDTKEMWVSRTDLTSIYTSRSASVVHILWMKSTMFLYAIFALFIHFYSAYRHTLELISSCNWVMDDSHCLLWLRACPDAASDNVQTCCPISSSRTRKIRITCNKFSFLKPLSCTFQNLLVWPAGSRVENVFLCIWSDGN